MSDSDIKKIVDFLSSTSQRQYDNTKIVSCQTNKGYIVCSTDSGRTILLTGKNLTREKEHNGLSILAEIEGKQGSARIDERLKSGQIEKNEMISELKKIVDNEKRKIVRI